MILFFADINFLGLFMNKLQDLSDKKNPSVTHRCRRRRRRRCRRSHKFVSHLQLPPYKLES
jgi:hypothetical protein